jgi:hypothetical protein
MSDPGTQLRAYLDQAVERVDVEDVMARTRVHRPRAPHPLIHWRPVWIAAAAALIMVISIGAVAAGAWLLRGEPFVDEFATRPSTTASTGAEWPNVLILGLAIGGGTIALLAGGNALANLIHRMRDRRTTMQTIESPDLELARLREDNARLGKSKRSLILVLVFLLIVVAGAAAWLLVANGGTAVERDIAALIDDYYAAWTADEPQGVTDLMTEDAILLANNGTTYSGVDAIGPFVEVMQGFHPQQIGNPKILAPTAPHFEGWFVAAHTFSPDFPGYGDIRELELFKVVEQDGNYLISMHETWLAGQ